MFYLRNSDPADKQFFEQALQRFRHMFSRMIALDNVILFDRNLGYQKDPDFVRAFRNATLTAQDGTLELRLNTLAWAGTHALQVAGDFVDAGQDESGVSSPDAAASHRRRHFAIGNHAHGTIWMRAAQRLELAEQE